MGALYRSCSKLKLKTKYRIMFLSCNLLTVSESAPAKPDSPKFSYVEIVLELLKVAIDKVSSIDRSIK
ncbi:hypothetical protein E4413_04750 [Leptospira interrogans]|nr:hypothetical protein E4414_04050 [Leptospira interrogans]QCO38157.1 hypothetical protein E4412_13930 [Leptospira interrogans]QCO40313.1 hypothetical protein E4413_04750 [Leptospira interrogans]QOI39367.1 hypothetical protein Lepto1548_14550 [Leptospira interrogans serovar Bataviae]